MRRNLVLSLLLALACSLSAVAEEKAAAPLPAQPIYHALDPAFVVNLYEPGKRLRYMQVSVQIMTREPKVVTALEENVPPVRDVMIMLLAHQPRETMTSQQGLAAVQQQALGALQGVLEKYAGLTQGIEAVYFTDFVIQ